MKAQNIDTERYACAVWVVVVFGVALETIAVANMVAYLSTFVKVKGKFWDKTAATGNSSSLMNEEVVLKLIENY